MFFYALPSQTKKQRGFKIKKKSTKKKNQNTKIKKKTKKELVSSGIKTVDDLIIHALQSKDNNNKNNKNNNKNDDNESEKDNNENKENNNENNNNDNDKDDELNHSSFIPDDPDDIFCDFALLIRHAGKLYA